MLKTLVVAEVFPPKVGGSGRWMWELYRRLPREAVSIAASEDPRAQEFDRTHDLRVSRLPLNFTNWGIASRAGLREYLKAVRQLDAVVRREGAEVLHCGKCLPEGFLAWMIRRWRGLPYVVYVHGEELTLAKTSRELGWLTRRVLLGADRIIANSRHTQAILARDWSILSSRIVVMHPGVDTTRFVPAPRDPAVRARLGWGNRPVILTVGALQKRKGQDMMIRALPLIREQIPDVLYSIAGEGWERPYLESLVNDLQLHNHVQFRGIPSDDELLQCYQQCDLFALPNRQVGWDIEGFGIVLLEAQACGKQVIAGKSGGTAETIDDGSTSWIVDCTNHDRLAAEVMHRLSERDMASANKIRGRIVRQFDWTSVLLHFQVALLGASIPADATSRHLMGVQSG